MEETVKFMDHDIPLSVFQKKLPDYIEDNDLLVENSNEDYSVSYTISTPIMPKSIDILKGLRTLRDISESLICVNVDEFITNLMFTYVNMKTNESIREKAKKFNIPEKLLFSAYYKIFLAELKRSKGNVSLAYEKVYSQTKISDKVIKSISAAKSNHKKHIKKVMIEVGLQVGTLKLVP